MNYIVLAALHFRKPEQKFRVNGVLTIPRQGYHDSYHKKNQISNCSIMQTEIALVSIYDISILNPRLRAMIISSPHYRSLTIHLIKATK
jgi:hypothetical protein